MLEFPLSLFPVPTRGSIRLKRKSSTLAPGLRAREALRSRCWIPFPVSDHQGVLGAAWRCSTSPYYAYEEVLTTFGDNPPAIPRRLLAAVERITGYVHGRKKSGSWSRRRNRSDWAGLAKIHAAESQSGLRAKKGDRSVRRRCAGRDTPSRTSCARIGIAAIIRAAAESLRGIIYWASRPNSTVEQMQSLMGSLEKEHESAGKKPWTAEARKHTKADRKRGPR